MTEEIRRGVFEIRVNKDYCKACGLCTAWCPQNVLAEDADFYPITPGLENCINCKLCERHCPDFAIEILPPEHPEHSLYQGHGKHKSHKGHKGHKGENLHAQV